VKHLRRLFISTQQLPPRLLIPMSFTQAPFTDQCQFL